MIQIEFYGLGTLVLELVRWSMLDQLDHTGWKQSKQSSVYPRFQFIPRLNWILENLHKSTRWAVFYCVCFWPALCDPSRSKDSTETPRRHGIKSFGRRSRPTFQCGSSCGSGMKETPDRQVHLICPDPRNFLDTGSVCAVWKRLEVSACFFGGEADIPRASACHPYLGFVGLSCRLPRFSCITAFRPCREKEATESDSIA